MESNGGAHAAGSPLEVLYISMLCEPSSKQHRVCSAGPAGVDDSRWFQERLRSAGLDASVDLKAVFIAAGEPLPLPAACRCAVLGGTFNGVHDDKPWQRALRGWLQGYRALNRPLLGICGGHQAMTVVLGGTVARREHGTAAGTLAVELTESGAAHALFGELAKAPPSFHFGNSDHVTAAPPDAVTLATVPGESPAVAIDYGGGWLSVQFHPESTLPFWNTCLETGLLQPSSDAGYREVGTGARLLANFVALCRAGGAEEE